MKNVLSLLRSDEAQGIFRRQGLEAVYLFGSHGQGCEDAASDIDIAVLFPGDGDAVYRFGRINALQQELKPLLPRALDLVSLNDADPLLAFEAVIRGKEVYARDEDRCFLYELLVRHRYEESCHIQDIFTRALKERLGVE